MTLFVGLFFNNYGCTLQYVIFRSTKTRYKKVVTTDRTITFLFTLVTITVWCFAPHNTSCSVVLGRVLAELFIFFTRAPFVMRIAFSINWPKVIFHMWSTVAACYISWLTHNELFSSLNYINIMSTKRNYIGIKY